MRYNSEFRIEGAIEILAIVLLCWWLKKSIPIELNEMGGKCGM
jgi:hypothetical protein